VSKGTINEFFLSSFLSLNNILPNQVRTVDIKFADVVSALSECKIDAGISFPPFSDAIKKTLGEKGIFWSAQGGQDFYFLVIVKDKLIETRPSAVEGLLKGLIDAEKFLKKDEKKAQAIVAQRLGIDRAWVADSWSKTHFHIGLDQALLTLMEDEGRWAMQNKLVEAKKLPNYLNFFYLDGLEKLKPDAVSVVH